MERQSDPANTFVFGGSIDFGKTAQDYGRYRAGFPDRFFAELLERGYAIPGQYALDVGTGSGSLARGLALNGLQVLGLDPARALLNEAQSIDRVAGITVRYVVGSAENLPFPDEDFELATAGQCWHWFDRAKAAREIHRVLKPGGHIVVAHFDWLPVAGNVVEATEQLILKHNRRWTMAGGTGLYPVWLTDLADAGFTKLETFSFDHVQVYSHIAWRGRIRASAGIKASLNDEETKRFDLELAQLLAEDFPQDPLNVPHRIWTVAGAKGVPPGP